MAAVSLSLSSVVKKRLSARIDALMFEWIIQMHVYFCITHATSEFSS